MTPRLRDERLCWLAVRDHLQRRARRRRMFETLMTAGLLPGMTRDWERHRLTRWSMVVDEASTRLSAEERAELRDTGRVPDWFLPSVLRSLR